MVLKDLTDDKRLKREVQDLRYEKRILEMKCIYYETKIKQLEKLLEMKSAEIEKPKNKKT